jgi:uncharacterized membrane protein
MTNEMVEMLPSIVPQRKILIYATGILEVGLAVALLLPATRMSAGFLCVSVLILFFPANIYAAIKRVGTDGHKKGPAYLLVRTPLQILLIV